MRVTIEYDGISDNPTIRISAETGAEAYALEKILKDSFTVNCKRVVTSQMKLAPIFEISRNEAKPQSNFITGIKNIQLSKPIGGQCNANKEGQERESQEIQENAGCRAARVTERYIQEIQSQAAGRQTNEIHRGTSGNNLQPPFQGGNGPSYY